jgi:hypothetical protein
VRSAVSRGPGRRPQGGCGAVFLELAAPHPASASEKPLKLKPKPASKPFGASDPNKRAPAPRQTRRQSPERVAAAEPTCPLQPPPQLHDTLGTPFFGGVERCSGLAPWTVLSRCRPRASRSIRRQPRQLPGGWSSCSNGEDSNGRSWSTRPSWRGASESSAPGCTPTRSSWGRSSLAVDRSHGFASTQKWRRRCCVGLARDRRLTRPPAQVSGRVSLRGRRERRSCFRSEDRGRTRRPRRLR